MPNTYNTVYTALATEVRKLHQRDADESQIAAVFSSLLDGVVNTINCADHACVASVGLADVWPVAVTDPVAREMIRLERTVGGPWSSTLSQKGVSLPDVVHLTSEERWPAFTRRALVYTPVRSILHLKLHESANSRVVLGIYSHTADAFGPEAVTTAAVFGTVIAMASHAVERDRQFQEALASRDVLGQAKGMLMERFTLTSDAAFDMLRQISQETNTKVATLAHRLISDSTLDAP